MQGKNSYSAKSNPHNETGSALVEIAVLLALVAMLAIAGVSGFGSAVSELLGGQSTVSGIGTEKGGLLGGKGPRRDTRAPGGGYKCGKDNTCGGLEKNKDYGDDGGGDGV